MLGSPGARARGTSGFGEASGTLLRLPAGAANDGEVLPLLAASRTWEPGLMMFLKIIVTLECLGYFFNLLPGLLWRTLASLHVLAIFFFKKERKAEFLRKLCSSSWGFWGSQQHPDKCHPTEGGVNLRDACVSPPSGRWLWEEGAGQGRGNPGFQSHVRSIHG